MKSKSDKEIKNIAFVSDAVYPFNIGGKEKRLYEVTRRLADSGFVVTVYTMKWWREDADTYKQDRILYKAISPYFPLYHGARRSIKQGVFFAISCVKMLFEDFDVVDVDHMTHMNLYSMKLVCLIKRKKMIATWHEVWGKKYWQEYIGPTKGLIAYLIEKFGAKLPDEIVAVSEHTSEMLKRVLKTKRKIVTIPAGVEVVYKTTNSTGSDIVFAGRLLPNKNVDLLLRSISILKKDIPGISLTIIGDGPEKNRLQGISNNLDLNNNVNFVGFVDSQDEFYDRISKSRVFAFPSSREGFGMVVIEANACGLPVVTVDAPDNASKYLIEGEENGIVCKLEENDLAHSLKSLLLNKKSKDDYVKFSQKYNWSNIVARLVNEYQS